MCQTRQDTMTTGRNKIDPVTQKGVYDVHESEFYYAFFTNI